MNNLVPFKHPPLLFEDVMSRRYAVGLTRSKIRAVMEVLDDPAYKLLEVTIRPDTDAKKKKGRPSSCPLLRLGGHMVCIVLGVSLREGRHILFENATLRARFDLPPITDAQLADIEDMVGDELVSDGYPSENNFRDFVSKWTLNTFPGFLDEVQDCTLRVLADVMHRHNLSDGWLGLDGKRALAATKQPPNPDPTKQAPGTRPDSGTAVFSRDEGEQRFNQRHVFPIVHGSVPLIAGLLVRPPAAEVTTLSTDGIDLIAKSSARVGELITELRLADGWAERDARHDGFRRWAIASDRALANDTGHRGIISIGCYPATIHPESQPTKVGTYSLRRANSEVVVFPVRSDGSVVCPFCLSGSSVAKQPAMGVLAGGFGHYIQVRCTNPTCAMGGAASFKISLRRVDRNDHLPGSSASRGDWNARTISMLPVGSDAYIVRRFLALQHVEWVHAQFEQQFRLGAKNPGFDRRMLSGDHSNRVVWALAALVWNINLRRNLDTDRATLTPVLPATPTDKKPNRPNQRKGDDAPTLEQVAANFWKKDNQIRGLKAAKKDGQDRRAIARAKRIEKRRVAAIAAAAQ